MLLECNLDLYMRALLVVCRRRATHVPLTCAHIISHQGAEKWKTSSLATQRKRSRVLAALMRLREAFLRIHMSSNLYKVNKLQIVAMYEKVDDEMRLQSFV